MLLYVMNHDCCLLNKVVTKLDGLFVLCGTGVCIIIFSVR